jgi:hypothetical protein
MRFQIAIACAVALLGCAATSSAQAVSLKFNNGRVTLNAQNAPVRTILTEWGRLGGTRIVNGDRVGGLPVTLELNDLPERQALDILLRSVAGYIVTERQGSGGVSTLGGVVILATSNAPRAQAPVTFGAATVQPTPRGLFEDSRELEERAGVNVAPVLQQPVVVRFPAPTATPTFQADTPAPNAPRPVTTVQTSPGTSRPGEISPMPQQAPSAPGLPPPPTQPQR